MRCFGAAGATTTILIRVMIVKLEVYGFMLAICETNELFHIDVGVVGAAGRGLLTDLMSKAIDEYLYLIELSFYAA